MEHLPIVIFEIVLFVFIAFAVLAKILLKQTIKQREKINELYEQIKLRDMRLQELEKFVRSNQVDFLCKSRTPSDPQYVDEWFRSKKMF